MIITWSLPQPILICSRSLKFCRHIYGIFSVNSISLAKRKLKTCSIFWAKSMSEFSIFLTWTNQKLWHYPDPGRFFTVDTIKYLSTYSKNNRSNKLNSESFHVRVKIGNANERHQYLYDFFKSLKNVLEK